jgi:hypothetical protein
MRTFLCLLFIPLLTTLGCAGDEELDERFATAGCCEAAAYPQGLDEGAHCCADGTWGADRGDGNAAAACQSLGGVCTEE